MGVFDDAPSIADSAPTLDPNVVASLAQMSGGDLSTAIQSAQATEGAGSVTQWVNTLQTQDPDTQNKTWVGLSTNEQQMMMAQGYKPPAQGGATPGSTAASPPAPQHRSLWSTITNDAGTALSDVGNALGAAERGVQHVGRAGLAMQNGVEYADSQGNMQTLQAKMQGGASTFNLFSPSAWQNAWTATTQGRSSYNLADYRAIQDQFTPDVLQLAQAKAEGRQDAILATAQNQDELTQMQQRLDQDPDVQKATSMLKWSQVSFGHTLIPNSVYNSNPVLANKLSGVADAVYDVFSDPTLKAGEFVKGAQAARYMFNSPEAAARLVNSRPAVQAWAKFTGDTLAQDKGSAALLRQMPHLADAIPDMQKAVDAGTEAGLTPQEAMSEYLKSTAGIQAALDGKLATIPLENGAMPTLTAVGKANLAAKGMARNVIDWAADRPATVAGFDDGDIVNDGITRAEQIAQGIAKPLTDEASQQAPAVGIKDKVINALVAPVGMQIRRTTTMITKGAELDLSKPHSLTQVQRFADTYLPRTTADTFVDAWSKGDIDTQRNLFKSMTATIADQSGGMATAEGQDFWQKFIQRLGTGDGNMVGHSMYAPDDIDAQELADGKGTQVHNAIWEDQAATSWVLPSFRDVAAHAQRNWIDQKLYGYANNGLANLTMQIWKPAALLRLGFGIRIGLDELGGAVARQGLGVIKAGIAAGMNPESAPNPIVRGVMRMGSELAGLDPVAFANVNHVNDIVGGLFGARAVKATRGMAGALLGDDLMKNAQLAADHGMYEGAFSDQTSAVEGGHGGMMYNGDLAQSMKVGNAQKSMSIVKTGYMKQYPVGDQMQTNMLHAEMNRMSLRPMAREIMKNIDMPEDELRQYVANDLMGAPEFQQEAKMFGRNQMTNAGKIVGTDATQEQARNDWAQTRIAHVKAVFTGQNGELNRDLMNKAADGQTISHADINALTTDQLPKSVVGPEMIGVKNNVFSSLQDAINQGFRGTGRIVDWMARQPLWTHNFSVAANEARPVLTKMLGDSATPEEIDSLVAQTAANRAYRMTAPFIHDPQLRTQFESTYQNLIPFMFAQRQFYQRWGRTFIHSPEAFRKAQLFYNGFQNAGLVQYDANGTPYFHYPATGAMMDILNKVAGPMFGQLPTMPGAISFDGQVKNVIAGLNETGPSFGPWVSLPVNALATHFQNPKLDGVAQTLLGQQGFNPNQHFDMNLFAQVVPGIPGKIGTFAQAAWGADPEKADTQFGSAVLQAAKLMQANPATEMPPNATYGQQAEFIRKATNQAKVILLGRLLLGSAVPAAPQMDVDPNNISKDYKQLISKYGLEEGQKIFLTENPNADAYTVFGSSDTGGGGYLPAYAGTAQFLQDNAAFMKAYNQAAPYFIPYNPIDKSFSLEAYQQQVQLGLRQYKNFLGPGGIADELDTANDANTYWQMYDQYQATLQQNPGQKTLINKNWTQIRTQYLNSRPLLASDLSDNASTNKKLQTLDQLTQALQDPSAPQNEQTTAMLTVMGTWNDYLNQTAAYKGKSGGAYTYLRTQLKDQTMTALGNYVTEHPDVSPLYNNLIRPLLDPGANAAANATGG